ncbi:MAG: nicotinate (nicotinamide) nucleotide adenylyltransferase, partial [Burkholderiales bacterium]|nr:nicotinate (nicotinamide) nucleotide adenylyltransferase [Burkholderiales bacterium]
LLECGASQMTILPAGNPYQRGRLPLASAMHRLEMLNSAFSGMANVSIDTRELERHGPTFTVDTLRELRQIHGDTARLTWLIGGDAFARLDSWHLWQSLFTLANFAIVPRQGEPHPLKTASAVLTAHLAGRQTDAPALSLVSSGKFSMLAAVVPPVSSTDLRNRLKNHQSIRGLAPDGVCDYIERHKLYDPQENT